MFVPIDFHTIQDAIDEPNDGDIIKVLPDTYTEQITISKNLTIIGSGAKDTIIESTPLEELELNVIGFPYIVNIDNQANVTIKGFAIKGIEGTNCDELLGISVLDNATLKLDPAVLKDCKFRSVFVGSLLTSCQSGHEIITNSVVTYYQETRVFAVGLNSTLQMSYNKIIGSSPNALGITGILVVVGATGIITNNEVNENICDIPNNCGSE